MYTKFLSYTIILFDYWLAGSVRFLSLNGSLNKADENTISNWMIGYYILGAGFVVPIPSINNYNFSSKKITIFTTKGWEDCTSQPNNVSKLGSGYNVFTTVDFRKTWNMEKRFCVDLFSRS